MTKRMGPTDDLIDPVLNFSKLPDEALVDMTTVRALLHCAVNSVWMMVEAGQIPRPIRVGRQMIRWSVGPLRQALRAMRARQDTAA